MPIYQDNRELLHRLRWLRIVFALVFICLFAKLWSLTVLDFELYKNLAERNRVRTLPQLAARGLIYDREGRILVDNVYELNLLLFRDEIQDLNETLHFLVEGFDLSREALQERLKTTGIYDIYQSVVVKENLTMEETAYLLARQSEHPELRILKQPRRIYRYGSLAAHVTGYVGEISRQQLEQGEFAQNKAGDIVGQFGVERTYNRILTGHDGRRRVLVDSRGKSLQELDHLDPVRGKELTLTIDLDLQVEAETQLGDDPGAVFAFHAGTGEILVMASHPAFDPNQFAFRITQQQWDQLLQNPDTPLQNRATQGTFSPGSSFKIIMALAGLESGVIDTETPVYCNGSVELYGHQFHCWKSGGHGRVTLREAIQHSCNVYFYLLGQKLGIQEIASFSRRLGLGVPVGIDLLAEASGLVPTEEWKREVKGEPWYAGETISLAIGQGPLLVTPAQLARAVGIIATGKAPTLHLLKRESQDAPPQKPIFSSPNFSPEHLEAIRDAMWSVVNDGGTGRSAQVANFEVAGKTGTAQTISLGAREQLSEEEAEQFESNGWFVGFAPRENPEIVVAVIVQRAGSGGSSAAPIAGEILKLYYQKYKRGQPAGVELASQAKREKRL
ncbi:penicillin-binding protein 2 [Acidobacteria bacterium AH-259-D05]|nr:penicillin-binding protein 2 [Acidobacteria bacterium AH-259-D05]